MKEYQTPLKELSRSSSSSARKFKESQLKKPQRIAKKSLNGVFSSAAEVVSPEINYELSDFAPVPDIFDANHCGQTAQNSESPLNPAPWASTDTSSVSDLTPTSEISTITDGPGSVEKYGLGKLCGSKIGPVEGLEADVAVKLLKEARVGVSNSDVRSKKVLDALTKAVMDEYYTLPEEKDWMTDLVSMKGRIVCLCFLIWSFVVSTMFLFGSGLGGSAGGPLPT
ncbi:protein SINE3 [Populus alba x Populus x berolinensis]|nr:protein SINE3 [Populus alba x Populus x berolinensis]